MSGQFVKERIEATGISLSEVARKLIISPQSLSEKLSVKDIKVGALSEIAKAIGKDLSYFLENYELELQNNAPQEQTSDFPPIRLKQVDNSADQKQLLKAKDELIQAQRKIILLYEQLMADKKDESTP